MNINMLDGNTAALDHYEAQEVIAEQRYQRAKMMVDPSDTRLEIVDSIFGSQDDSCDFIGFATAHADAFALILLAVASVRRDILPAGFDDTQRVRLEAHARQILDDFVDANFEAVHEQRIQEVLDCPDYW